MKVMEFCSPSESEPALIAKSSEVAAAIVVSEASLYKKSMLDFRENDEASIGEQSSASISFMNVSTLVFGDNNDVSTQKHKCQDFYSIFILLNIFPRRFKAE